MLVITATGNLGKDAESRQTQSGDEVLSFSMGVQNGFGRDAGTLWFRCSIWGARAKSLAGKLRKGDRAMVVGTLTVGEYQGKPQYDIRVSELDFTSKGERSAQSDNRGGGGGGSYGGDRGGGAWGDDLDDDVPFISCGNLGGHRNI